MAVNRTANDNAKLLEPVALDGERAPKPATKRKPARAKRETAKKNGGHDTLF